MAKKSKIVRSPLLLAGGAILILILAVSVWQALEKPQSGQAAEEERWPFTNYALPDLTVRGVESIYARINPRTGGRELRFSTTLINLGHGPFEVHGAYDPERNQTKATQRVLNRNNTWEERLIGYFVFHPGHDHWHVEDMTQFELFTYNPDGTPNTLLATTDKLSFCMFDDKAVDLNRPGAAPARSYFRTGCDSGGIQGISVGWSDIYTANIEGQHLNIDGLADGRYLVRSTVDPVNLIVEQDNANNSTINYIEIIGNAVRVLPGP